MERIEDQISRILKENQTVAEWSLCRIKTQGKYKYFFRLLYLNNIPEGVGDTIEEAVYNYIEKVIVK